MGDVNPGAQLVAGGNIVVLGTLRGVAHAGALGDAGSVVFALNLQPTQLRIADVIAIAPKEEQKTGYPELAHATEGKIVIVPYNAGFQGKQLRNV
jgi:septum site-determining protein MinC